MVNFLFDKIVEVKRKSASLGEYNRPQQNFSIVGTYECHISESTSSTSQLTAQKSNTTNLNLYTEPEAEIKLGDVLFIYEMDEYGKKIESTLYKAIADKPYKKRTLLRVPLVGDTEV